MIAADTNILVRLLTGDDATQFKAATKLFSGERVFIPDTVLLETEWVLRAAYRLECANVCDAFRRLLGLPNVVVADGQRLANAIGWHQSGLDFADALHLSHSQDCDSMKTFDADFIKQASALGNCRVERP